MTRGIAELFKNNSGWLKILSCCSGKSDTKLFSDDSHYLLFLFTTVRPLEGL